MTGVCTRLGPKSVEDITAIIALYRPGPMDSIPKFLENSGHPEKISYKHPSLEPILSVTYGCIVYQEQGHRDLPPAGRLLAGPGGQYPPRHEQKKARRHRRRAAGLHPRRRGPGYPGCLANGISESVANSIYDEILDFASYAFNKSHAVAYAIVAYRTAYMKCHHPREYMSALLTSVLDSSTKVAEYIGECRELGIRVLPPDVNESGADFTVAGANIRFGLTAIKNIGASSSPCWWPSASRTGPSAAWRSSAGA